MTLEQRVAELEAMIPRLLNKKETLLKGHEVMKLTGWDKETLRRKRVNGHITARKRRGTEKAYDYVMESLPVKYWMQTA